MNRNANLKLNDKITVKTEIGSIEIFGNGIFVIKANWGEDHEFFKEKYECTRVGIIDDLVKKDEVA